MHVEPLGSQHVFTKHFGYEAYAHVWILSGTKICGAFVRNILWGHMHKWTEMHVISLAGVYRHIYTMHVSHLSPGKGGYCAMWHRTDIMQQNETLMQSFMSSNCHCFALLHMKAYNLHFQ